MKAEFYVSNVGGYFGGIWLGLGEYCTVCAKPGKMEKEEKGWVMELKTSNGTAGFSGKSHRLHRNITKINPPSLPQSSDSI